MTQLCRYGPGYRLIENNDLEQDFSGVIGSTGYANQQMVLQQDRERI